MEWFYSLSGLEYTLLATAFTWLMTALGAATVFFCKKISVTAYSFFGAFAGGIMLASSFFSLLVPAIERASSSDWLILTLGLCVGAATIVFIGWLTEKTGAFNGDAKVRNSLITCVAVTVHNFPEGMAIGVAFGALGTAQDVGLIGAIMLAVGIAVQNLPEGACVAFPLRNNGVSRLKSFLLGQFSGMVEVFAGVVGVLCVSFSNGVLPFALTFSAGAMIAVVCSTLMPESYSGNKLVADVGLIAGFIIMMALDLSLG